MLYILRNNWKLFMTSFAFGFLLGVIFNYFHSRKVVDLPTLSGQRIYALHGFPANLQCGSNSSLWNGSQIEWIVGEDVLIPNVFTEDFFIRENDGHLIIKNPLLKHSGLYQCKIQGNIYSIELIVIRAKQTQLNNTLFFDDQGSFRQELLSLDTSNRATYQSTAFGVYDYPECEEGYETSENGLFCIPCQPGFRSNRMTKYRCTTCSQELQCVLNLAYRKTYGQSGCYDLLLNHDNTSWIPQHPYEIPKVYGVEGRLEILHCNPGKPYILKELARNGRSFKWTIPKGVKLSSNEDINTEFQFTMQQKTTYTLAIEGNRSNSGMYFCTVIDLDTGEQVTYGQEVLFVSLNLMTSNLTLSFPNHYCNDEKKHNNSLIRLQRQMNMIWNHPYSLALPGNYIQDVETHCEHTNVYSVNIQTKLMLDYMNVWVPPPQCESQHCLIQSLTPRLDEKHKVFVRYVKPYFEKAKKVFEDTTLNQALIPSGTPCPDGFETGEGNLICVPCTPGMYSDQMTQENGRKMCKRCPAGLIQYKYGQSTCEVHDESYIKENTKKCEINGFEYSGNCTGMTIIMIADPCDIICMIKFIREIFFYIFLAVLFTVLISKVIDLIISVIVHPVQQINVVIQNIPLVSTEPKYRGG